MNILILTFILAITGCSDTAVKKTRIASLTCESSQEDRSIEELQAIGDACFRGGHYTKSSHKTW